MPVEPGSFLYLVECKRYTPPNNVSVELVRSLYGVVEDKDATGGMLVTSSFFTKDAQNFQSRHEHRISLRDYVTLQKSLMRANRKKIH